MNRISKQLIKIASELNGDEAYHYGKYKNYTGIIRWKKTIARVKNAFFKLNEHGIIWQNGIWQDGIFDEGIWQNGTWKKGEWRRQHDNVWKDGTWENGCWYGGIWQNGTWKNGGWSYGVWKDGTWEDGYWNTGNWISGYDKDGNKHEKGDSPDKWDIER